MIRPKPGLVAALRWATVVAFVAAGVALVAPGTVGATLGVLAVVVVVAAPLIRIAWLAGRWRRLGDRRYTRRALLLLLVVALGCGAAAVQAFAAG